MVRRPHQEREIRGPNPAFLDRVISDLKPAALKATLPGTWCFRVGTGWSGVSILWLGDIAFWSEPLSLCGSMQNCVNRSVSEMHFACCWDVRQPTNSRCSLHCLLFLGPNTTKICPDWLLCSSCFEIHVCSRTRRLPSLKRHTCAGCNTRWIYFSSTPSTQGADHDA